MLPRIIGEFRVVHDPELKFTPSGVAVCSFRVVADRSKKNPQNGEWEKDKECWLQVATFNQMAEHVAESVQKGTLVTIVGQVETQTWDKQDGTKGYRDNILADYVGLSLTWDAARSLKAEKVPAQQAQSAPAAQTQDPWATGPQPQQQAVQQPQQRAQQGSDPWAGQQPNQQWNGGDNSEPPF